MEEKSVNIIVNVIREKRQLCNRIKTLALNNNGILFGGIVRDDIIGRHYRNLFLKKGMDIDKYWDVSYDNETKHRLIIPNDIDVFFRADNNSITFQNRLREFVKEFNGYMSVSINNTFEYSDNINNFLQHKVINISLRVGKTLFASGVRIAVKIDLIEINYSRRDNDNYQISEYAKIIEPPFNKLDFLCNVFISEKSGSGTEIVRISNCTGTPIDEMTTSNKMIYAASIINDIINFKTKFARINDSFDAEYYNCYRILKMINRKYPWTITNLPFKFILHTEVVIDDYCCICLDNIIYDHPTNIIELNTYETKSKYLHSDCFINYLTTEQKVKFINSNDEKRQIECRCPFRCFFNFRDCYKSIEYI